MRQVTQANHFEAAATKIEKETGQYFVCRICGGTAVAIPKAKCPIRKFPSEMVRKIDPPIEPQRHFTRPCE